MEETTADASKKVEKIINLIKNRDKFKKDGVRSKKESELVRLIEDFHKQHQSLFASYDNLKRESGKLGHDMKAKEGFASPTSSESEYFSSDETEANRSRLREELEAANVEVAELKHQLASKTEENEALVSNYTAALSKVHEAETINKTLKNEMYERDIYEVPGDQGSGQISDLEDRLTNLEAELFFKDTEAKRLSEKNKLLEAQIFELKSMCEKQAELEALLEKKNKKTSLCVIQIKTLKEELSRKNAAELKILEERECLLVQLANLNSEVETLHKQKSDMEKQFRSQIPDTSRSRGEKKAGDEASAHIVTLKADVEYLQQELDTSKNRINQLELHLKGEKDQNMVLTSKIAEQQRIINDQEKAIDKFIEDSKMMKRWSWSTGTTSKINQNAVERKMEDLEDKFRKKIEDSIRLLYQRIRVAEKTHYENTENFQKMKDKYEQENKSLKEKVAFHESEAKKLWSAVEPGINALVGLDVAFRKVEQKGNFLSRISNARNDIVFAKNWASGRNNEIKMLRMQVDDKVEQEFLLREKVWNLEAMLGKEVEEKLSLVEAVSEMEKRLSGLGEEKREAIRQLCVLIDYHRSRYIGVKGLVSNSTVKTR